MEAAASPRNVVPEGLPLFTAAPALRSPRSVPIKPRRSVLLLGHEFERSQLAVGRSQRNVAAVENDALAGCELCLRTGLITRWDGCWGQPSGTLRGNVLPVPPRSIDLVDPLSPTRHGLQIGVSELDRQFNPHREVVGHLEAPPVITIVARLVTRNLTFRRAEF